MGIFLSIFCPVSVDTLHDPHVEEQITYLHGKRGPSPSGWWLVREHPTFPVSFPNKKSLPVTYLYSPKQLILKLDHVVPRKIAAEAKIMEIRERSRTRGFHRNQILVI